MPCQFNQWWYCTVPVNIRECVLCVFSSHLLWTSSSLYMYQPGSQRRKVTQDFSSTFHLRCMPLFFSREGFSRSFPSSTVKSNFVYYRFNPSPLVGHFYFYFLFLVGKIQVTGIRTHVPTCQKVTRLPTERHTAPYIPGRPACSSILYALFVCTNTYNVFKFIFYLYWYFSIVYFVRDSAPELERWALIPFWCFSALTCLVFF